MIGYDPDFLAACLNEVANACTNISNTMEAETIEVPQEFVDFLMRILEQHPNSAVAEYYSNTLKEAS